MNEKKCLYLKFRCPGALIRALKMGNLDGRYRICAEGAPQRDLPISYTTTIWPDPILILLSFCTFFCVAGRELGGKEPKHISTAIHTLAEAGDVEGVRRELRSNPAALNQADPNHVSDRTPY